MCLRRSRCRDVRSSSCLHAEMWFGACFLLVFSALAPGSSGYAFSFASYYGDHMVLQKAPERAVVWGYSPHQAEVEISLSGPQSKQVNSTPVINGIWKMTLDPVQAGGPYSLMAVQRGSADKAEIVLTDILFGDVWLCGGQSNMAFTLGQVYNASEELTLASKFPNVRVFQAALEQSAAELTDLARVEVLWSRPTPEILGGNNFTHFSAVCWLFGRHLYETLKYPIGLVESCWSGSPVEAWSSPRVLHKCGLMTAEKSHYENQWANSKLWNAMIHPLLNMTIKGAIWYQGEANAQYHQAKYSCTFPTLIDDWRMAFHEGSEGQTMLDFPFGFVQLCTFQKGRFDGFPEIRWHQTADYGFVPNERMKKTFMAVAMDLPDNTSPWGSIHPRDKQDVAYRLVLGARAVAYEEEGLSFQGPFPSKIFLSRPLLKVTFDQMIKATPSDDTFEICCSKEKKPCDSTWFPAPIIEQGSDYISVSIDLCPVDDVKALRYAWSDWPCAYKACPIYSADSLLPAPPFMLTTGN